MLRRSLFSLLLGNAEGNALTQQSATGIDSPSYLKTEHINPLVEQFDEVIPGQVLELKVSTAFNFSISWSTVGNIPGPSSFQLGIKAPAENSQPPIELGLHADGYLFIGDIKDKRALSLENNQHVELLLEVHPQEGNLTYAKLTLRDAYGLTLAMVKNSSFSTQDWAGDLINGSHLKRHLKIEGSTLK
jgi:hypothetical protein